MKEPIPQQYTELFHLLFLDQLGRKLDKRAYILKGGCNLRFYLKSIRYSEDIDLDVRNLPKDKLQTVVENILDSNPFEQILQIRGLSISRWSAPKQTETTQRWKLTLTVAGFEIPLHTKIEFSRRGLKKEPLFDPIDPSVIAEHQLSPIMVSHYDAHAAYEQKVEALVTRSTTQARDIFDLNLLLNTDVNRTVSDKTLRSLLSRAQANAMTITFDIFKSQVLSFLHPDYRAQYDSESVWEDIVLRVTEALSEEEP